MHQRIKILVASHTYVVAVNQRKVEELAKIEDLSVRLLVPSHWRDTLRETKAEKLPTAAFETLASPTVFTGRIMRYVYHPRVLWQTLSGYRPDIVHVEEEPGSLSLLQVSLLKRLFGFRVVLFTWENIFRQSLASPIEKVNLAMADGATAGNQEAVRVLRRKGFSGPISVVPQLGVDIGDYTNTRNPEIRTRLGLRGFVVGYVGRFVEEKGLLTLVEAVARLEGDVKLLLLGKGPLKPAIENLATKLGAADRLVFLDAVVHDEVPAYINCLDALVLPSLTGEQWKEQFGHVLVEAMASGVPVVGSSSGAIPEVIGNAGLVFAEGDANALQEVLTKLTRLPDLRTELSRLGKERVAADFTHQKVAERTREFYGEVLRTR